MLLLNMEKVSGLSYNKFYNRVHFLCKTAVWHEKILTPLLLQKKNESLTDVVKYMVPFFKKRNDASLRCLLSTDNPSIYFLMHTFSDMVCALFVVLSLVDYGRRFVIVYRDPVTAKIIDNDKVKGFSYFEPDLNDKLSQCLFEGRSIIIFPDIFSLVYENIDYGVSLSKINKSVDFCQQYELEISILSKSIFINDHFFDLASQHSVSIIPMSGKISGLMLDCIVHSSVDVPSNYHRLDREKFVCSIMEEKINYFISSIGSWLYFFDYVHYLNDTRDSNDSQESLS